MFKSIVSRYPLDGDYPLRVSELKALASVLDGSLYDVLPFDFHTEKNAAGEYIPLRERRPSVRYALCNTVVDDSVSLLFSEGHFPAVVCADESSREVLAKIVRECRLNEVMLDAAKKGSVGSVVIRMRVLSGRLFFDALSTWYMTPLWRADAPDTLECVTEKYKVCGQALIDLGYAIDACDADREFWFQRRWDAQAETWFWPWPVFSEGDEPVVPVVDAGRSVVHKLGFVPMVWVRNLPGGVGPDGACTFAEAINTSIEIDYLLSQAGRGLKYSSDPTLLIKEPAVDASYSMVKGAGNAITVSKDGDAKLLEINGSSATAVIDFVRCLRELALESIHGNRSNADRLGAAQSGRAMELMNQALIWLADKLRISYGEGALLELLQLVVAASQKFALVNKRGERYARIDPAVELSLRWPAWNHPTNQDLQNQAHTLRTLADSGLMSRETALRVLAENYDIEDVPAELALIIGERPLDVGGARVDIDIVNQDL